MRSEPVVTRALLCVEEMTTRMMGPDVEESAVVSGCLPTGA
jgi:hypothetical protein